MSRRRMPVLTEREWSKVFAVRCRAKRGERLTPEEQQLCELCFKDDPKRYAALTEDVFNATKPFGSE